MGPSFSVILSESYVSDPLHVPETLKLSLEGKPRPQTPREAWELFATPPRTELANRERTLWESSTRSRMETPYGELAVVEWGSGPRVILSHGWGGRALQLSAFVHPLVEDGFTVTGIDWPGHGDSGGETCTALMVAGTLQALGEVHGVVAHSFGTIGSVVALGRGWSCGRAVLLGASPDVPLRFRQFGKAVGLSPAEYDAFWTYSQSLFDPGVLEEISSHHIAPRLGHVPALLVHDEHDQEAEIHAAEVLAEQWPGARLERTTGLGHRRILHARAVVQMVRDFMKGEVTQ